MAPASSSTAQVEQELQRQGNLIRRRKKRAQIGQNGRVWLLAELLAALVAVGVLLQLLFLVWWRPALTMTGGATALGIGLGMLYSYLYSSNVKRKHEMGQLLSMDPGLKGCQFLLGAVPGWIKLTDREKMEWLNHMLEEMWPYYDKGICKMIKDIVEPIMDYYKPPGVIKKIWFQELTFGDAPFRVEGIFVKEDPEGIDMEVDVRWCGDANITLAVDAPFGGAFTRLTPKVCDIVFVATIKIIFKPLVEKVPGFAAVALSLKTVPIIKYRLDFGMLPGGITSVMTAPIVAFINSLVNVVLVGMLLWPKRFTVPLLSWDGFLPADDPEIDTAVERLDGRPRGVIKVQVLRAKDLKSFDVLTGKSDPFVELFTTLDHRCKTKVIKNNLSPVWEESFYLPVLEVDQVLHLEVFDHDTINLSGALTLQIWKAPGAMLDGQEFMARSAVPLADIIRNEGEEEEGWFALGRGDWTNLQGPGKGEGTIRLALQYRSIETLTHDDMSRAQKGLLLLSVLRCYNLVEKGAAAPKVQVKAKVGQQKFMTWPQVNANPRWSRGNKFTFYEVDIVKTPALVVEVEELGLGLNTIGLGDDCMGKVEVPLIDVLMNQQESRWTGFEQHGYMRTRLPLEGGASNASVELELEFLPVW